MITINFLSQQNRIIEYIKSHYEEYILEGYPPPNDYTSEFLDYDKFKNDFTVFLILGTIHLA